MSDINCLLFALRETREYGEKLASHLGLPLCELDEFNFLDGEHKIRPQSEIENKDVFLIQSLYQESECSLDRKLIRTLFLVSTLKSAGAKTLVLVAPYLAYARQDRREKSWDPLTNQYLATLLEAAGIDGVITIDVHNLAAFQNAYRCRTLNLEASGIFAHHLAKILKASEVIVISPDAGGVKRAKQFAKQLGIILHQTIPLAIVDKSRLDHDIIAHRLLGDARDKTAILYDDLISTGSTIFYAARACREAGARQVIAVATHGLFCGKANEYFNTPEIDQILTTDTIISEGLSVQVTQQKVIVVSTMELLCNAFKQLNSNLGKKGIKAA